MYVGETIERTLQLEVSLGELVRDTLLRMSTFPQRHADNARYAACRRSRTGARGAFVESSGTLNRNNMPLYARGTSAAPRPFALTGNHMFFKNGPSRRRRCSRRASRKPTLKSDPPVCC